MRATAGSSEPLEQTDAHARADGRTERLGRKERAGRAGTPHPEESGAPTSACSTSRTESNAPSTDSDFFLRVLDGLRGSRLGRCWRLGAACAALALVCGCGALKPAEAPRPHFYALDDVRVDKGGPGSTTMAASGPTLIVSPPRAGSGFDSQRIIYLRQPHSLEHYAYNEWVDTPARMLAPLVVRAVERSGAFRAVVPTPSTASGDMRLDTEIMRLQHEFLDKPSRVRFTLRAYLVDNALRRVIGSREFEAVTEAESEDAYGGVKAANEAVRIVLAELAAFCGEAARGVRGRGAAKDTAR